MVFPHTNRVNRRLADDNPNQALLPSEELQLVGPEDFCGDYLIRQARDDSDPSRYQEWREDGIHERRSIEVRATGSRRTIESLVSS